MHIEYYKYKLYVASRELLLSLLLSLLLLLLLLLLKAYLSKGKREVNIGRNSHIII